MRALPTASRPDRLLHPTTTPLPDVSTAPSSAIPPARSTSAYNGWSGDVNFNLPWPGTEKQWYRVTDTATWNEGPNAAVVPGSEAFICGEGTVYGL
ncbi:hypothetical protein [Luteimonas suaedae]|uniref:hypothetical protein n=1 Tax=Luteimonas suaedae TaxID=2605430 RepID=UPI0031B7FCC2